MPAHPCLPRCSCRQACRPCGPLFTAHYCPFCSHLQARMVTDPWRTAPRVVAPLEAASLSAAASAEGPQARRGRGGLLSNDVLLPPNGTIGCHSLCLAPRPMQARAKAMSSRRASAAAAPANRAAACLSCR